MSEDRGAKLKHKIDLGLTVGTEGNSAQCATGEAFETIQLLWTLADASDEVRIMADQALEFAALAYIERRWGGNKTIYWRCHPEFETEGNRRRLYMRLMISDKAHDTSV